MRQRLLPACALLAVALVTACSGERRDNEHVRYNGSSLTVDGVDYPREAGDADHGGARVVVRAPPGGEQALLAQLDAYGLDVAGRTAAGELVARIPEGFESQWARALSDTGRVASASPDASATLVAPPGGSSTPARAPANAGAAVPAGEPPEDVVRALTYEMYAEFEKAGGIPLTFTATGESFVVHQQLASVQKDDCRQLPGSQPGEYECSVLLKVRSCIGDCDPSREEPLSDAKRIDIRWDPSGKWVRG